MNYGEQKSSGSSSDAVAPVIAVILLVAMTVLLIGIFVGLGMGMADSLQSGKQVGLIASAAGSGNDVTLTLVSGTDIPNLVTLEVLDADSPYGIYRVAGQINGNAPGSYVPGTPSTALNVAAPRASELGKPYSTHILVRGTFTDGTQVVLLKTAVTFPTPHSQLDGVLEKLYIKNNKNGTLNLSFSDLFLSGRPITLNQSDVYLASDNHGLVIEIPDGWSKSLRITGLAYRTDGAITPYAHIPTDHNTKITVWEIQKVDCLVVTITQYSSDGEPIGQQEGTIYIDHTK